MENQNYRIAFSEVLYIINNLTEENQSKISKEFISFLEKNKMDGYVVSLPNDVLSHKELLKKETKIIIAIMYRNYFLSNVQKEELDKIWFDNEQRY